MKRKNGNRVGAGWEKSLSQTKITREMEFSRFISQTQAQVIHKPRANLKSSLKIQMSICFLLLSCHV